MRGRKMLWAILAGVAGVLAVFAVVAATRPSAYHVERKLEVAATPEVVFGVLNDLHLFSRAFVLFGSPLVTRDPKMETTFGGPATGVGQSFAWSGDKEVGAGKMTIEQSVPGQSVGVKLDIAKPMASTALVQLSVTATPTGSVVTWSMDGNHNFIGKAFGIFVNMDKMIGADIDKGLVEVKHAAEAKPTTAG